MTEIKKFLELEEIDPIDLCEKNGLSDLDGFGLSIIVNNLKKNIMKNRNDTYYSITYSDFIRIVLTYGFKIVYEEEFLSSSEKVNNDIFNIMFHDDGILLVCEKYGDRLNSGHIYYNISPIVDFDMWYKQHLTESGMFNEDMIWSGYHDIREGIILKMDRMKTYGNFINPWKHKQYFQLLNYKEWHDVRNDYDKPNEITKRKFNKLPENVKKCVII